MCHVFRCDSAPAKEIANSLRDACRRIINEKNAIKSHANLLKRPSFLSELATKPADFSRYKSTSCHDQNQLTGATVQIPKSYTQAENLNLFQGHSSTEEPKKTVKCRYLGSCAVTKPSGMDTLNEALEKVYLQSLDAFKRARRQNKKPLKAATSSDDEEDYDENYDYPEDAFTFDMLDLNGDKKLGVEAEVVVSPSTVSVRGSQSADTLVECRVRYLSFMGISNDVRLCGFIVHCVDNTFKCHAFLCENSSGNLMKAIEAACRVSYFIQIICSIFCYF